MRVRARVRRSIAVVAVFVVVSVAAWWAGRTDRSVDPLVRVVEVVDGDTVVVAGPGGRETVRILGVDTPETVHPTKGVECFGPEASAFTAARLSGAVVRLESDVETHDVYGRRLATVRLDGRSFAEVLVRRGFARFLVIAPNDAHARALLAAESAARAARRGLWAACPDP